VRDEYCKFKKGNIVSVHNLFEFIAQNEYIGAGGQMQDGHRKICTRKDIVLRSSCYGTTSSSTKISALEAQVAASVNSNKANCTDEQHLWKYLYNRRASTTSSTTLITGCKRMLLSTIKRRAQPRALPIPNKAVLSRSEQLTVLRALTAAK